MKFYNQKIKIYNTKTSKKEIFNPIKKGFVGIYICGPTVYNKIHIGNLRTFISFDLVNRYFKYLGYKVRYIRNITDAGHMIDSIDNESNYIENQSILEKIEPMQVVQKYTIYFHKMMSKFNILDPDIEPTATGHILEQIEIIKQLISKGFAYESYGSVYFDILEYNKLYDYGKLSHKNLKELFINSRILEGQIEKKNPWDFALWKKAKKNNIQKWNSPWGLGSPGWHLECTVMSNKYLGKIFDIHGGGLDLKFPHHECELAQAIANNGKDPVNYWMHSNLLFINGEKMSKSKNNFICPDEIIEGTNSFFQKKIHPIIIKFFLYQTHYRSILNISNEALIAAEKGFHRLNQRINLLKNLPISNHTSFNIKEYINILYDSINDDFNTPVLIANLFKISKIIRNINSKIETINEKDYINLKEEIYGFFYKVLGLKIIKNQNKSNQYENKIIDILIDIRHRARLEKNWKFSDIIRNRLAINGIILTDSKNKTTYKIKN